MITPPSYNYLLIELVATLDSLITYSRSVDVRNSAKERKKRIDVVEGGRPAKDKFISMPQNNFQHE